MDLSQYVEVTIFGEKYKLVSSYKDQERILKIASLVDERMESLSRRFPNYSKAKIAILTSLNLADELFKQHSDQEKSTEKVESLIKFIEANLPQKEF